MFPFLSTLIAALLAWWRGRDAAKQADTKAVWAEEKSHEVEDANRRDLAAGDAANELRSQWSRKD